MSIAVTFKSDFGKIGKEAFDKVDKIVRKTAFEVERGAKQSAPVDTGALRASIYTATRRQDNSAKAKAESQARRPDGDFLAAEKPTEPLQAIVAVGMEYGIYVEYGTTTTPAQPFLTPATTAVKQKFEADITKVLEGS